MLGLFLLLPVLALYARELPDYTPVLLGLAMGAYGLTQALLQIPFGRWSDRYGRKPVIVVGLGLFAAGSLIGALAQSVTMLIIAPLCAGLRRRIGGPVSALLADLTRPEVRTRAMAVIGASIGLSFVLALVLAPCSTARSGWPRDLRADAGHGPPGGIALLGGRRAVSSRRAAEAPSRARSPDWSSCCCARSTRRRCSAGVFALHFIMTATFLSVPQALVTDLGSPRSPLEGLPRRVRGLARRHHPADSRHRSAPGAVQCCSCSRSSWWLRRRRCSAPITGHLWAVLGSMTLFFAGFIPRGAGCRPS